MRRASGTRTPTTSRTCLERGNKAQTEAAFARAAHIVKRRYVITRVHAQYMEPRVLIGSLRSGPGPLHAPRQLQLPAPRPQHAGQPGLQGAGEQSARRHLRCRRRFRHQGLALRRGPAGAVGVAQAQSTGEMAMRAFRSAARRRACARQCRRDRTRVRRGRTRSSACASTCWPASAPISHPTGSC